MNKQDLPLVLWKKRTYSAYRLKSYKEMYLVVSYDESVRSRNNSCTVDDLLASKSFQNVVV